MRPADKTNERALRASHGGCWLLVCLAWAASGCAGGGLPRIDPTGEHILIPAGTTPPPMVSPAGPPIPGAPGLGTTATFVSVTPTQVIAPVGTEVVLVASVGTNGFLLTHTRVEWTISPDGVGEFASPGVRRFFDFYDFFRGLPRKNEARYAVNSTLYFPMRLDRGTTLPQDDVFVNSGQSWVTVTSPTEGTSNVTVFAPVVVPWDRRQQTASIYWVNAQWRFPTPAISGIGSRNTLTTAVTRQSDNAPLAGWRVRYEIAGGPPAGFAPDGAASVEIVTNAAGDAPAEIFQKQELAGANPINIQVIRPAGLGGQDRDLTIGSGATSQTWAAGAPAGAADAVPIPAQVPTAAPAVPTAAAAQLDVTVNGPSTAGVNTPVQFEIQVVNRGSTPATHLLVTDRYDDGLQHSRGASPIEHDLIDLQPGAMVRLTLAFQATASGQQCQEIEVTGDGGARGTARHCLSVEPGAAEPPASSAPAIMPGTQSAGNQPSAAGGLSVRQTGPARRTVGQTALFSIEITNGGSAPLQDLVIANSFESALEPDRATQGNDWLQGNVLGWKIPAMSAGQTLRREIEFKCLRETPRACNRVTVSAKDTPQASDESCLEIASDQADAAPAAMPQTPLSVSVADTADPIKVGGQTTYQILVENKDTQSQFNVALAVTLSPEVELVNITGPVQGSVSAGIVRFAPIRELRAGEQPLSYELRVKAARAGTAQIHAEVTTQAQSQGVTADQTTQVLP